jgi:hypothetical protein
MAPTNSSRASIAGKNAVTKATTSAKSGGKIDSPVKTGRAELMKIAASRSPSKTPAASLIILERVTNDDGELLAVLLFLSIFGGREALANFLTNWFAIRGQRILFAKIASVISVFIVR